MESKDEKYLILEQYRIYSDAKERFIDRQFSTNKFYLTVNIIILLLAYVLNILTPQFHATLVLAVIGIAITIMWTMSIDTYQTLIKVKYAKALVTAVAININPININDHIFFIVYFFFPNNYLIFSYNL